MWVSLVSQLGESVRKGRTQGRWRQAWASKAAPHNELSRGLEPRFLTVPHAENHCLHPSFLSRLVLVICESNIYTVPLYICSLDFGQHSNLVLTSSNSQKVVCVFFLKEIALANVVGLTQSAEGLKKKDWGSPRKVFCLQTAFRLKVATSTLPWDSSLHTCPADFSLASIPIA